MDRGTSSRTAKVSDVPPGLDARTVEAVKPTSKKEGPNSTSASDQEDAQPSEVVGTQKRLHPAEPGHDDDPQQSSFKRRRRRGPQPENLLFTTGNEEVDEEALYNSVPEKMRKYFAQRHRLFHRYDEGIQLDEEAWYSVTPEKIAAHIASRFSHLKVVVDLYSCVGGNTIQFAKAGLRVIAVELDQDKIDMAKNNAKIYGVEECIEFKKGDVFEVLSSLKDQFDSSWGIFLSPPWGGPGYAQQDTFDLSVFRTVVDAAIELTPSVAILVPRNISEENVTNVFGRCEVEENYLGGKLKTITLYFGDLEARNAFDETEAS